MSNIQLCDINSCTQCHACEAVCPQKCISFKESRAGFFIPHIDVNYCIECGLCRKSCHQIRDLQQPTKALPTAFAAWTTNSIIRSKSSSGGVFSVLANEVISKDGVVYGAIMTKELQVKHVFAETIDQISAMRGSKYVQSNLEGVYIQVKSQLQRGKLVLFTGTPCQIAGLYAFLRNDYQNLITCDLVCHGVPSQKAFDIYCERTGLNKRDIDNVRFRYTEGWGLQMAVGFHKKPSSSGDDYKWKNIPPRHSYFLRAFTKGLMFNEACYECKYASKDRISDITLADFWGIGSEAPFNYPVNKGVSLLLVNTDKGQLFLNKCDNLFMEERPLSEAINGNHNLHQCSLRPQGRDTYYEDSISMSIAQLLKKYDIKPSWKDYVRPIKRKFLTGWMF